MAWGVFLKVMYQWFFFSASGDVYTVSCAGLCSISGQLAGIFYFHDTSEYIWALDTLAD